MVILMPEDQVPRSYSGDPFMIGYYILAPFNPLNNPVLPWASPTRCSPCWPPPRAASVDFNAAQTSVLSQLCSTHHSASLSRWHRVPACFLPGSCCQDLLGMPALLPVSGWSLSPFHSAAHLSFRSEILKNTPLTGRETEEHTSAKAHVHKWALHLWRCPFLLEFRPPCFNHLVPFSSTPKVDLGIFFF